MERAATEHAHRQIDQVGTGRAGGSTAADCSMGEGSNPAMVEGPEARSERAVRKHQSSMHAAFVSDRESGKPANISGRELDRTIC